MAETRAAVGPAEVATLKELALEGALAGTTVTCAGLAERLDASNQTASRRLQRLDETGFIDREVLNDGQRVQLTPDGEARLRREHADYRRVFEGADADVTLHGTVTAGMGEGRHYISLPGYMEQFVDRLGYEPFAGTLNVDLDEESVRERGRMDALDPVRIDGWEDDERTYGPAFCWPATIETDGGTYDPAHVIAPERTHHGDDQLEVIAPDRLRDELGLEDGEEITVRVTGEER
ncbi:CTP-dependent riboflavin kinase [Haloglomus salinum]|uniref:CTP-dependent riboflavin kinase n=1 Tax=Haloglomus salinum TaxID=2962673 RepID=UPI0020C9F7AF|nr:CTP-dependent riboflavin kinase [Haloglomus salinum]